MINASKNHEPSDNTENGDGKEKGKRRGCLIGCLGIVLFFLGLAVFSTYMSNPQSFGDKHKIIADLYRYEKRYGKWPESIKELKQELPDHQFKYRYGYFFNDEMFVVGYQGSGLLGDDSGEFYRSDTKKWKDIYSNHKDYYALVNRLSSDKE